MPPSQRRQALLVLNDPHPLRICGELAQEIGFGESVIFLQLEYLISISNTKEIDGNLWSYQSLSDLREFFPWWNESTISRYLDSLISKKLILFGNYNRNKQDRTRWWALNWPEVAKLKSVRVDESILQNAKWLRRKPAPRGQHELPIPENEGGILQIATPILHSATTILQNETTLPEISPETSPESSPGISSPHSRHDPSQIWNFVLGELEAEMNRADYQTWIKPLRFVCREKNVFLVEAVNGFTRDWICSHVKRKMEHLVSGMAGAECRLMITMPGEARSVCAQTVEVKK